MDSFLNGVVSNTAFAGALALIAFGVQRTGRSPQFAHALWLLVLIKLVTPPVFHVAFPARFGFSAGSVAARESINDASSLRNSAVATRLPQMTPFTPGQVHRDGKPIPAADISPPGPVEVTPPPAVRAASGSVAGAGLAASLAARWPLWLCAVWGGGVIVSVAILFRRLCRFKRLLIEAVECDATLIDDVRMFAGRLGMRRCPSVRVLDAHVPPLVCAGWRSLILMLPARLLKDLDREQLHAVLVHELAHIRRSDHLTRWFEIFVRAIFWWHPLAWWASRQLRQAEEECCDAWVVWALPNSRKSYGKALLWTVEFLAERRLFPIVTGAAFGGSHVKRRIEMIVNQKLNRRMSWGAVVALILLSAIVLPVAAQIGDTKAPPAAQIIVVDPIAAPRDDSQAVPKKGDLEARIEQLERLVQELSQTLKGPAVHSRQSSKGERPIRDGLPDPLLPGARGYGNPIIFDSSLLTPETEQDRQIKEVLAALDKKLWAAIGKGDWTVTENLLDDDYFGFYANSSGIGRTDKATEVAAVKRRRCFDGQVRDQAAKRIGKDTAIFTYIYSCKIEEGGRIQTYRDHQSTQVWTQKDGRWLISYAQDSVLPGGE